MKRTIQNLIAVAVLLLATVQMSAAQTLQALADYVNEQCPMEAAENIIMEKITVEDNNFRYHYTITNPKQYQSMKDNQANQKETILTGISTSDSKTFYEFCIKKQIGFYYTYTDNGDPNTAVSIYITPDDLKEAITNQQPISSLLSKIIENERKELPQQFAEGMVATDIYMDDENLVYVFEVSNEVVDVDIAELFGKTLMDEILDAFASYPTYKLVLSYLVKDNKGFVIKLIDNESQKTATIKATVEQIQKRLDD